MGGLSADRLYIVAECGGTHNGSLDTALQLIQAAKEAGADAVKFTMRDLDAEMSPQMAATPYPGPHSYGATYGEHRAALEVPADSLAKLRTQARAAGLEFGLTVCAPRCVGWAEAIEPDWLKVASRDAAHGPLLEALRAKIDRLVRAASVTGMLPTRVLRIVVSDGLGWDIAQAARDRLFYQGISRVILLHCVSAYPASTVYASLDLAGRYGYSDHVPGWHMCVAAVANGATWIEKHLTIDRNARGTDHQHSLEPGEFARMVLGCREVSAAGSLVNERRAYSWPTFAKLGRSVAVAADLGTGHVVTEADLHMVSPGTGLPWAAVPLLVGKRLRADKRRNELLTLEDVE